MKRSATADKSADRPAKKLTAQDVLQSLYDDSEDDELDLDVDYPDSEIEYEPVDVDLDIVDPRSSGSDSDADVDLDIDQPGPSGDQLRGGRGTGPRPRSKRTASKFDVGWSQLDVYSPQNPVDTSFNGQGGPQNMPDRITNDSTALDFLSLFLDDEFWANMCGQTNRRARQLKEAKPDFYYTKNFREVDVQEMKAFIGLRLTMESTIKPRYADYWTSEGTNFLSETPGFRKVMERDRFLAVWTCLHLVDELDPNTDKTDKLYKVRPMLNLLLPRFRYFYAPHQHLSLDEGMIPSKNRLAIKQYVKSKPIKWGIKAYMICDSNNGYILNTEIYTGQKENQILEIGVVGNVVYRLVTSADLHNKNHVLVMDRFYNSVTLFDYLYIQLGTLAVGTVLTNRKYFPKEIASKKKMPRGQSHYKCHNNIVCLVWMDQRPIHFVSNYHNPENGGVIQRRLKDGTAVDVTAPQICIDYNNYMGGCDNNDQMARINKSRRHYRWPRRLTVKFFFWACYNAYILMDYYNPHNRAGKRYRTFGAFMTDICLQLVGDYRTSAVRRSILNRVDTPVRLQNVGLHMPIINPEATGNNLCVVCAYKYNQHVRTHPNMKKGDRPVKQVKTKFYCTHCHAYLCIKEGSTCWADYHTKQQYWR